MMKLEELILETRLIFGFRNNHYVKFSKRWRSQ